MDDVASKWEVSPEPVPTPEDILLLKERRARLGQSLRELLSGLGSREVQVLRLRYGLGSESPHTLGATGDLFGGLSKERIRQIECKALRKLKHPSRSRKLADFTEGWNWWNDRWRKEAREKADILARNQAQAEAAEAAYEREQEYALIRAEQEGRHALIRAERQAQDKIIIEAHREFLKQFDAPNAPVIRRRVDRDHTPPNSEWLNNFLAAQNAWIAENLRQKQARMAAEEQTDGLG
jgi:hypothetical protein